MKGQGLISSYPGDDSIFNIANIIGKNATLSGLSDKVAVIDASGNGKDKKFTYQQLNQRVNRLANALRHSGIKKGDRVFVLMPNRVEILELLLGSMKIGAVYTPANFRLSAEEIRFMIKDVGAKIVFYDTEFNGLISQVFSQDIEIIPLVEIGGDTVKIAISYELFTRGASIREPGVKTKPSEVAVMLFTAGTTGRPKGVKLSHKCMFFANLANGTSVTLNRDDIYLGAPPMFHAGGVTCFNMYTLMVNGTIIMQNQWTPAVSLKLIKKYGVTFFFGIATQLKMLVQVEGWEKHVKSLRMVNGGGEPQPAELKKAFMARGISYVSGYGLTETGATGLNWYATSMNDPTLSRASECIGKPTTFLEVKVVDENDKEVKAEEAGQIIIRREPTGAIGYWNRPEEEPKKFRGDWIYTGDLGKYDNDGFFYVLGRVDDMIISGGENIYPSEIERAIFSLPQVADVVVVKGKHSQWGQTPKAVILLKPGHKLTEQQVVEQVVKVLGAFKKPRKVTFVQDMPRAATGKVDKKKIKEMYEEK
ncbi:MAG: AMP-binding protein [Dehalococcoidia bacterium]|nr:AMP-binding protein [Dehalococcoidia bacterium]